MSRIRGWDTKPEWIIRRGLHARGLRFRLHRKDLPGKPDIVFPKHRAAILVHGCFWHGHGCHFSKMPATRTEFWRAKIDGNAARDKKAVSKLMDNGWRVLVIWECALRGEGKGAETKVLEAAKEFIWQEKQHYNEIASSRCPEGRLICESASLGDPSGL